MYLRVILQWQSGSLQGTVLGKAAEQDCQRISPKAHSMNFYFLDISEYLALFININYQYLELKYL